MAITTTLFDFLNKKAHIQAIEETLKRIKSDNKG